VRHREEAVSKGQLLKGSTFGVGAARHTGKAWDAAHLLMSIPAMSDQELYRRGMACQKQECRSGWWRPITLPTSAAALPIEVGPEHDPISNTVFDFRGKAALSALHKNSESPLDVEFASNRGSNILGC
jgi:hypothetical protein